MNVSPDTLAAATRGEAPALREVIDALQRPLYNLALRMLGSHEDAEEATQEALLRVVTHLSSFRGDSRFSTWAWTVATRVVLQARKRRASQPIPVEAFEADLAAGRDDDAVERVEEAVMLQQVKIGCSRAMLQILDDDHRLAYTLGDVLGLPGPQAAEVLGINAAAYRKRLSRARTQVRGNLTRMCGVVNREAPCRCHRRLAPAKRMGRLHPRDAEGVIDLPALRATIRQLEELSRDTAFYGADPRPEAGAELLDRVHRTLGMAS